MYRVAFLPPALLLTLAPAAAQEAGCGYVVAPYKEQVCSRGPTGYAFCRWVDRSYVAASADCTAAVSARRPAYRERAAARRIAPRG